VNTRTVNLRTAIARMAQRYGQAEAKWAYARNADEAARWSRACTRRYFALMRLVDALTEEVTQ